MPTQPPPDDQHGPPPQEGALVSGAFPRHDEAEEGDQPEPEEFTGPGGRTLEEMLEGLFDEADLDLDEATHHLLNLIEGQAKLLNDSRQRGSDVDVEGAAIDLVELAEALACVSKARRDLATREERAEFMREAFALQAEMKKSEADR